MQLVSIKMILARVLKILDKHIHYLFYYDQMIMNNWPDLYNYPILSPNQFNQFKSIYIKKSFLNIKLPSIIILFLIVNNIIYLRFKYLINEPYFTLVHIYPEEFVNETAAMCVIWGAHCIGQYSISLSNHLIDYYFLWIIHLEQIKLDQRIHRIRQIDWLKLIRLRNFLFIYTRLNTFGLMILVAITLIGHIYKKNLLNYSPFWTIFWYNYLIIFSFYFTSSKYF